MSTNTHQLSPLLQQLWNEIEALDERIAADEALEELIEEEDLNIDFEMRPTFATVEQAFEELEHWMVSPREEAQNFKFFGQDGTGSQIALWLVNEEAELDDQPVVVFGSEGDNGMIAANVRAFLSLFAQTIDPTMATRDEDEPEDEDWGERRHVTYYEFVQRVVGRVRTMKEIGEEMNTSFPTWRADFNAKFIVYD